jgi:hypothetical protein
MSANRLYTKMSQLLDRHMLSQVDESSRERLKLMVLGIIKATSSAPAQIARTIKTFGHSPAKVESIERRIRRAENDPEISVETCFYPFVRAQLRALAGKELRLLLDPTTQDDRVVKVQASLWYGGRALPLAWMTWPANKPLEGPGFWERIAALLAVVATLLPAGASVTWLADRAFGTPAFTDLLAPYGWHYVVRVQGQTRCQDRMGVERRVDALVSRRRQRAKMRGKLFKKHGWRDNALVVYWGRRHEKPLCLASDLDLEWDLIYQYRQRYPIEASFRDEKSFGWEWERSQVTDLEHIQRLLIAMALATWLTVLTGAQVAREHLAEPPSGRRRTLPWLGKRSLFALGLQRLEEWFQGLCSTLLSWQLTLWRGPNWQTRLYFHHARAFVFAPRAG